MKTFYTRIFFLATLLLIIISNEVLAQAAWTNLTSGTATTLNSVQFINNKGWAVGNSGVARNTINGGANWAASASGTGSIISDVCFTSETKGWFAGSSGVIHTSNDGGLNWTPQTSGTASTLRDIHFLNASQGWAVGNSGTIRSTIDGGLTWTGQTIGTTFNINSVFFINSSLGWLVAGTSIYSTTDGGSNWTLQYSGASTLTELQFISTTEGWAVGNNGVILKTVNGGSTWIPQVSGTTETLNSVYFVSATHGWAVGTNGVILYTTNGSSWSLQNSGTISTLNSVYMESIFRGWVVGSGGIILEYSCSTPSQPTLIAGNDTPCIGTSQTYSVLNTPAVSYNWTFPSGWIQTAGGATNSITATIGTGSGNIIVTPSSACGNGTVRTLPVTVYDIPDQPSIVTGDETPCEGTTQSYSVTNVSGVTYNWSFPSGWIQTAGGTTNVVNTTVGTVSGNITVTPSSTCGIGTAQILSVSVNSIPAEPVFETSNNFPCEGSNEAYSVFNISDVNYNWDFPIGWSQITGGVTNNVTVIVGSNSGNITVTPSNECGNGSPISILATVSLLPAQPSNIIGSVSPCAGSSQTYSVTNVSGIDYSWSLPNGWSQTAGGNSNIITVTAGTISGTITVTPSDACGNGFASELIITPTSIDNSVTLSGTTLNATQTGATYQWLDCNDNMALLSGENGQSFVATANGSYAVEIDLNGCIDTSVCEMITSVGIEEMNELDLTIYPNPSSGQFTLSSNVSLSHIEVSSISGERIYEADLDGKMTIQLELQASPGIYLVKTTSQQDQQHIQRVILK